MADATVDVIDLRTQTHVPEVEHDLGGGTQYARDAYLVPGENHIGAVGGSLIGAACNLRARPANTTAYANQQSLNISLAVSAATNASPSVITTSANHGLSVGDWVTIAASTGNTAINGNWQVLTTPSATTFTVGDLTGTAVAGNGAWVSGGTVAQILYWPSMERVIGNGGYITKVKVTLQIAAAASISTSVRVWFYNAPVTAQVDTAAFNNLWANNGKRLGFIDISLRSEGAGSDCVTGEWLGSHEFRNCSAVTGTAGGGLWGLVEMTGALTPVSGGLGEITMSADRY